MHFKYRSQVIVFGVCFFLWLIFQNPLFGTNSSWGIEDPVLSGDNLSETTSTVSVAKRFLGEKLTYYLGFLWFDQAADCVIKLQRDELSGQYLASMCAKTRGFIGWLTGYRENLYVSHLEEIEGGRRLRPVLFEKRVTKGDNIDISTHRFDYQQKQIDFVIIRNNWIISQDCVDIPEGIIYEDLLSAFYNFRAGVFGEIKTGHNYVIPSLPDQGIDKYTVEVLDQAYSREIHQRQDWSTDTDFILRVKVSKEIFGTREGLIWIQMSKNSLPLRAVAEDAIGLGDVSGELNRTNSILP
jgi:hypothetical protein